jgi:enoyl-CoA hydratase
MEYKNILFNVDDGIAIITFNRPKALNAMNSETMSELLDAATICKKDENIKVVILTGSGDKAFVAGADIAQMQNLAAPEAFKFMEFGHDTLRLIETMPKPSIAAVNGFALGGGTEISLACDMRFAAECSFWPAGNINRPYSGMGRDSAPAAPGGCGHCQRANFRRRTDKRAKSL